MFWEQKNDRIIRIISIVGKMRSRKICNRLLEILQIRLAGKILKRSTFQRKNNSVLEDLTENDSKMTLGLLNSLVEKTSSSSLLT